MKVRVITSSSYLDDACEQPLPPGVYTVQQRPGFPPHFRWEHGHGDPVRNEVGLAQGQASFRPVWASESFRALVVVLLDEPGTLEHTDPADPVSNRPAGSVTLWASAEEWLEAAKARDADALRFRSEKHTQVLAAHANCCRVGNPCAALDSAQPAPNAGKCAQPSEHHESCNCEAQP